MEKCLRLFSQRAVTRVNDVEASAERFRVEKFDSRQLSRTEFLSNSKLRKECHAKAAVDHTLGGFDGVDFERNVWHQAGAAEKTVGQSPVARSAFVENQRQFATSSRRARRARVGPCFGCPTRRRGSSRR